MSTPIPAPCCAAHRPYCEQQQIAASSPGLMPPERSCHVRPCPFGVTLLLPAALPVDTLQASISSSMTAGLCSTARQPRASSS